ncbi:MAG: GNAT family N-acetyltransferase [Candidatus Geothermarchaeales archaeon]
MTDTSDVVIRDAEPEEVDAIADLALRLKRLNGEFDPMFQVREDAEEQLREYLSQAIHDPERIVLVAVVGRKVVGMVKADLVDRLFYVPKIKGEIVEFYVLPEFRRKGLGEELMEQTFKRLNKEGADIIAAEFPALNQIAVTFYKKQGFQELVYIYAKTLGK